VLGLDLLAFLMGLCGKILVTGGYRSGFCENLPPRLIKPMPAGSKMDLLLAKANPISDSGSTSVITYLRKGRKNCSETAVEREE